METLIAPVNGNKSGTLWELYILFVDFLKMKTE